MIRQPFSIVRHSFVMVHRTLKSYLLLSVTIILSFSLLLGYLVYTDSSLYNQYKELFCRDRNVVVLGDSHLENNKMQMLLKQTSELENTWNYIYYETNAELFEYGKVELENNQFLIFPRTRIFCIPDHIWSLYDVGVHLYDITYLDEQKHENITLHAGEAILDTYTFQILGLDDMEEPIYPLQILSDSGEKRIISVKVVATVAYDDNLKVTEDQDGNTVLDYESLIILSQEDLNSVNAPSFQWGRNIVFYSETPELVTQIIDKIDFMADGSNLYEAQNKALLQIQTEKRTKAMIAVALLLLLGINLYSSFTNALNDRKFEIGVKRALGATSLEIIRQFLYESILVMLVNILLSVVFVNDVFLLYKFIYESTPDAFGKIRNWIIYVSPYSVAMFVICSVTLTVVFSLIFAYQSTQVEIVQYLKAE